LINQINTIIQSRTNLFKTTIRSNS